MEGFTEWVEKNIILIGAIALGVALVQVKHKIWGFTYDVKICGQYFILFE